ncbi:hypothetical protein L2E82_13367 [Cichorium intybus]|uniref:Uncharacterized protein n=1 Tax=Cichorium intybus TaxID=13427 RepID=A0ACB9EWR0_CICIN|nr:hypothetical protein L2E82_13367 [Cichorium intybus]
MLPSFSSPSPIYFITTVDISVRPLRRTTTISYLPRLDYIFIAADSIASPSTNGHIHTCCLPLPPNAFSAPGFTVFCTVFFTLRCFKTHYLPPTPPPLRYFAEDAGAVTGVARIGIRVDVVKCSANRILSINGDLRT